MIIPIKHMVDWEFILQQKQTQINRDNDHKNKHRVEYDYIVGNKIMITYHTACINKTPYKFPFVITQCFTNGTVNLQYGPNKIRHNVCRIKP